MYVLCNDTGIIICVLYSSCDFQVVSVGDDSCVKESSAEKKCKV